MTLSVALYNKLGGRRVFLKLYNGKGRIKENAVLQVGHLSTPVLITQLIAFIIV